MLKEFLPTEREIGISITSLGVGFFLALVVIMNSLDKGERQFLFFTNLTFQGKSHSYTIPAEVNVNKRAYDELTRRINE